MVTQKDYYLDKIKSNNSFSELSAKIHGFIITSLDKTIATKLHDCLVDPFSMFCINLESNVILRVTSFNEDGDEIIKFLDSIQEIKIITNTVEMLKIQKSIVQFRLTVNEIQNLENKEIFDLNFITPTSFKKGKEFYPIFSLESLFGSLVTKLKFIFGIIISTNDVERICNSIFINNYSLNLESFLNDGKFVKGFVGNVQLKTKPNVEFEEKREIAFLLRMISLFGAGIRTGVGMGGVVLT